MDAEALHITPRLVTARRLAAVTLAVSLAGCATVRTVPAGSTLAAPAAWSATTTDLRPDAVGDISTWWQRLGDPAMARLIEQALRANPDVRTAESRLREARARTGLARANQFPTVTASGAARDNKNWSPSNNTGSFSAGFDASWEPDVFGARRLAVQASQADLQATAADLEGVRVSLAAEAARDYVDVRSFQARLDIARRNEAAQAETLQLTEWRMQAGLVSEVDVAQARTNLEQTRAQIPSLEASLAEAKNALAILLGLAPGALSDTLASAAPVPTAPSAIAVGIPADTLRHRPDVRAAELRLVAETARLGQSRAARYPSFSLTGSLGIDAVTGVLTGGTSTVASLAASVLQTVFDAGRIRQQIEIQNAVQERALIAYESTVLVALQDVENALVVLAKNRERTDALARAADSAENAVVLARNRYSAGLTDFQTVLDTQRTALSIEDSLASNRAEGTTAVISLYKALGGGWSSGAASTTAAKATGTQS